MVRHSAAHRLCTRDGGAEAGVHEAPRRLLGVELGCADKAPAVADAPPVAAERLHHAVAIEPMPVALTVALIQRRAIAVQRAAQLARPVAFNVERIAGEVGPGQPA